MKDTTSAVLHEGAAPQATPRDAKTPGKRGRPKGQAAPPRNLGEGAIHNKTGRCRSGWSWSNNRAGLPTTLARRL
jgi:hypothetical protein